MFTTTRLKLTAWYLSIIMVVSLFFSLIIYQLLSRELNRFVNSPRFRFERNFVLDPEILAESKRRLAVNLIYLNGGILLVAGGLGYFLAGRTLRPISQMIDSQNRFISDSSHEFRTPLTSIKTAIEVALRDRKITLPQAKKLFRENLVEVDHLENLSNSLLRLTQFEKPKTTQFKPVSLRLVINQSLKRLSWQIKNKKIKIINQIGSQSVSGLADDLADLFVILIDNAVKYSSSGQTISLSSRKSDRHLSVSITDRGIGISPSDLPHIFDRFYRADQARSKNGYGLGLSIAKKIADSHHAVISVTSQPGQGSTFTVKFQLSFS